MIVYTTGKLFKNEIVNFPYLILIITNIDFLSSITSIKLFYSF